MCGAWYKSQTGLRDHQVLKHGSSKALFQCGMCKQCFQMRDKYESHLSMHMKVSFWPLLSCFGRMLSVKWFRLSLSPLSLRVLRPYYHMFTYNHHLTCMSYLHPLRFLNMAVISAPRSIMQRRPYQNMLKAVIPQAERKFVTYAQSLCQLET